MGPVIELELRRPGFFPAGGGRFHACIAPVRLLARFDLLERGTIRARQARAIISKLPTQVADRELAVVREQLSWREDECSVEAVENPVGPGNALLLKIDAEHITEVFTSFGERGRSAEEVARGAAEAASSWLRAEVPVDEHLADQLLIPMALAGGGWFRTVKPSLHSTTNATIIQRFLPVEIRFEQETAIVWRVVVTGK
jgi:RNA 3'-terminal phosphate cyclase (ATP)